MDLLKIYLFNGLMNVLESEINLHDIECFTNYLLFFSFSFCFYKIKLLLHFQEQQFPHYNYSLERFWIGKFTISLLQIKIKIAKFV